MFYHDWSLGSEFRNRNSGGVGGGSGQSLHHKKDWLIEKLMIFIKLISENGAVWGKLIVALEFVIFEDLITVTAGHRSPADLIEVAEDFVFRNKWNSLVSNVDAGLVVAEDLVVFDLRVTAAAASDATPLVLLDSVK